MPMSKSKIIFVIWVVLAASFNGYASSVKGTYSSKKTLEATRCFLLDLESTVYDVSVINLNTTKVYNKNLEITLYNLKYDQNSLILFSVLPTKNRQSWRKIEFQGFQSQLMTVNELKETLQAGFEIYKNSGGYNDEHIKREDIRLIIKKNNKYFVSENCITEYFKIITQPLLFPNLMGNAFINIKAPTISVKEFEDKYKAIYKRYSPNSLLSTKLLGSTALHRPLEKPLLFISASFRLFGYEAYKFWQFTDWPVVDGNNFKRGIDRFVFIPEIGIVGGSFDAWFLTDKSMSSMLDNYMDEVVILPNSINDIVTY